MFYIFEAQESSISGLTVQGIVQPGLLLLCTELTLYCIELPENCIELPENCIELPENCIYLDKSELSSFFMYLINVKENCSTLQN